MKNLIYILIALFMLCSSAYAATYYVATNGSDSYTTTQAQNIATPWQTIQKAASTMVTGDIVYVRVGTYNESITPGNSGTSANLITYQNYGTETVHITGTFNVTMNYIVLNGFEFSGGGRIGVSGSYCKILNNYVHDAGPGNGIYIDATASYDLIAHNRVNSCGGASYGDQVALHGSNIVFEYNELSDTEAQGEDLMKFTGYNNVIRGNYMHDLGSPLGHCDAFQCGGAACDNVLIANNILARIDGQFSQLGNWAPDPTNIIYRGNEFSMLPGKGGWGINDASIPGVKIVNNTFGRTAGLAATQGAVVKNNIFCNSICCNNDNPYGGGGDYNLISTPLVYSQPGPHEIWTVNGVDPKFVDYANYDFHLQSNSPCINAGTFLTTSTSSGSGTQIPVADAKYFTDGRGISDGDLIQLEGQTQTAQITSINYTTNVLTINQSLTWTNGLGVSTPYSGSVPDMGCYEYQSGGGDTQAPSVPTGLASSSITQTSFTLSWTASTDNVGVTGYEVFKNGASIGTSASTSMSVTGLTASTTYSMTVRARDAVPNWSAQSTVLNVTTSAGSDTQAPSVPTGLTSSSITQTSFTLSWTASTDNVGVTGYEVFKNAVSIGTSATTSMSVTGLTASTTYSMTVRARDAVPNWSAQSTALIVTTASVGDTQAPSVPTGLTSSSIAQTSFTLNWTASTDNVGVTGYEVFKNAVSIGTSASASMSVTGLTANTTYSMTVRARDAVPNWSAQSTALIVTTASAGDTQAPSVPTGLASSSITQTSFTLSWTASTDNVGVTGYEVFKNGASIGTSASASMSVTGLTASTTYSMTVRARDAVPNWSAQSTALNVTTQASGGTTRYEAENAALTGVTVGTAHTGYSGTGYIVANSFDASGDNITFTVNVTSAGSYPLAIRYSTSIGSPQHNYLVINGGSQIDVFFPNTDNVWTTLNYGNINLNAGNNTVGIWYEWGYIDVDYIEIGGSAGDTQAPSVPTGLTSSSITQTSFTLNWAASTDNVGVTGYEVFKNGASIGTSASASMSVTGLTQYTTYSMTVRARDAVPNWSAQSTALIVTTASAGDTQAPSVPTGLTSSSIAQTSFTLTWTASTDNVGVTGYEVFKNGASIGTSATASMSVTGLTASTTYSMTVRARDAVPNWSAQSTALKVMTASASITSSTTWQSFTRSTQTGTFTAAFDAVPNTANMNGVTGIQNGTATNYPNMACAVRFYTAGKIEAINGGDGVYSSSTTINYTAGTSYHFRLVINVTAHTYSIYVTPNGQGEVTLGTNYAFRSQQAGVTQLTGWCLVAETGTHTVSNMTFGTSGKISQAQNNESEAGNNADAMPSKSVTFSLSQNYPNPFNPTTNIEYRIANTGFVSLKIYDVLGREVSTLVNGQKSIGIYTVQWDASNLPSGVYFSRLTVQTQAGMPIVMTKKILFTK